MVVQLWGRRKLLSCVAAEGCVVAGGTWHWTKLSWRRKECLELAPVGGRVRMLGKPPSACQAAKSDANGPNGLVQELCAGKRLQPELPTGRMERSGFLRASNLLG